MAFYNDKEEENQQDPNASTNANAPLQPGPSGPALISGTGGGGAPGAQAQPKPDKPGNFVGLNDYLSANKMQSQKLGDQVSGHLNQEIGQASQAVAGLGNQFGEKVKAGQVPGLEGGAEEGTNLINKAANTGQVSDQEKQRFGQLANAQYSGPNSLTDATDIYQPAQAQVQKANEQANLTSSEAGKQQLLRNMNNSPNYTTGAQRFDSYLLNNPNSKAQLAQAKTQAGTLQGQLSAQEQAAGQQAAQAKSQTQSVADAVKQALGGASSGYQNNINHQLGDAQAYGSDLAKRVNQGQMTDADIQKLGIQNMPTYGIDFKNYFQQNVPTAAGVTTADEKAKYDALSSLGGDLGGLYAGASPQEFGSYSPSANTDAFKQAVDQQKNLYEVVQPKQKVQDYINSVKAKGIDDNQMFSPFRDSKYSLAGLGNIQDNDALAQYVKDMDTHLQGQGSYAKSIGDTSAFEDLKKYLFDTLPAIRGNSLLPSNQVQPPPLPTKDGEIDWSKINAPKGK